ncbi:hypothetical protein BST81_19840 [Leptolyngbya sp. 'hensonii']|uniref:tetratricopeptide repeat protein n=1 Tax=Leptolyngbya sp. 'hensonii' TaxID=1922337 RepID=UPI000963C027|nr:tetratricopeptide repeat protein [Leptolyngbya sp. 'hensonii']OLP16692.1 hypothetical protein BST81_19840 [Leptolyngbya sp. 'hensonii']
MRFIPLSLGLSLLALLTCSFAGRAAVPIAPSMPVSDQRVAQTSAPDLIDRANQRVKQGDNQGAIQLLNQALKLKPKYSLAYYNRGNAKLRLRDYPGAISDYNQAIRVNVDWGTVDPAYAYINRGVARTLSGDRQGAIADYTQALKVNPQNADAYYNRGLDYRDMGDNQRAVADFKKAATLYQQQGNTASYESAIKRINELQ